MTAMTTEAQLDEIIKLLKEIKSSINANTKSTYDAIKYFSP